MRVERAAEWRLSVDENGRRTEITARALVNAAGPWIDGVTEGVLHQPPPPVRLVKGSHIVVRKLFDHDRAYIFQARDGRVIFAIPYEGEFTVIGTTDKDFQGDLATLAASDEEIAYLCEAVSGYFRTPVRPSDVVWSYAGVRSLYDDGASAAKDATRDYVLKLDHTAGAAPVLMIYGGKITTYRRLAEEALDHFAPFFALKPAWTGGVPLPGGDFPHDGVATQVARALARWPFLREPQAQRMVRAYGTRLDRVLGDARTAEALGEDFGAGLSAAEVRYLMKYEWARTADDVLWRRSKLGLHLSVAQREAVTRFMTAQPMTGEPGRN